MKTNFDDIKKMLAATFPTSFYFVHKISSLIKNKYNRPNLHLFYMLTPSPTLFTPFLLRCAPRGDERDGNELDVILDKSYYLLSLVAQIRFSVPLNDRITLAGYYSSLYRANKTHETFIIVFLSNWWLADYVFIFFSSALFWERRRSWNV